VSPSSRIATLPFQLTMDHEVIGSGTITSTEERRHGVVRFERDTLVVQWRVEREVQRIGPEIRTDVERAGMRDVPEPVRMLGDARVRTRGRWWWRKTELVLTARDLVAFDRLASDDGFTFDHPAELVLPVRPSDVELANEFASEVELAIAELALADVENAATLPPAPPIARVHEAAARTTIAASGEAEDRTP
jgi:hypothetical protein